MRAFSRAKKCGDGSITLEAEDGRYTVALRRVTYLRRFAREARVGFGSG